MYEKCTSCERLGRNCFPNLYEMEVEEIRDWAKMRQKYKGWTYSDLSAASGVPKGTIASSFSKKGCDVNYSTFAPMLRALVGGEPGESPCPDSSANMIPLQEKISRLEQENELLKEQVNNAESVRRADVKTTKAEKQTAIDYLKRDLQFSHDQMQHKDEEIKKSKYRQIRTFWFFAVLILLYLLLFDLPCPEYGIIRSEALYELIETLENAFSTGIINTALITTIQWII